MKLTKEQVMDLFDLTDSNDEYISHTVLPQYDGACTIIVKLQGVNTGSINVYQANLNLNWIGYAVDDSVDSFAIQDDDFDDDEPHGSHDLSDDAEALASAGWGTDEDYGDYGSDEWD